MKTIYHLLLAVVASAGLVSCSTDLLDEKPKSSYSPENAYVTLAQFNQAIADLHRTVRDEIYWETDGTVIWALFTGTDQAVDPTDLNAGPFADYSMITSSYYWFYHYWVRYYRLVARANTVIDRATAKWSQLTPDEQLSVIGQAKFFRAYAYRCLANLYGGVPKIDHEVTAPRKDFQRATREEIYDFCREDLEYASNNLTREADGRGGITAGVADHLLSEIYICLGRWQDAVNAATRVIDDPQYELMTERFGTRMDRPGDVFWDLFRTGNVNREDGNKETIWALQYEFGVPGGQNGNIPTWNAGYPGERAWGPRYWTLLDPTGAAGTLACDSLGRGASYVRPTYYASTAVWKGDEKDMRNSEYNIKRNFYYNNPASSYYKQLITRENLFNEADTIMAFYPYIMKVTDYPHESDYTQAQSFRDVAVMRLAETYLLRAEAYLGMGRKDLAAGRHQRAPQAGACRDDVHRGRGVDRLHSRRADPRAADRGVPHADAVPSGQALRTGGEVQRLQGRKDHLRAQQPLGDSAERDRRQHRREDREQPRILIGDGGNGKNHPSFGAGAAGPFGGPAGALRRLRCRVAEPERRCFGIDARWQRRHGLQRLGDRDGTDRVPHRQDGCLQ